MKDKTCTSPITSHFSAELSSMPSILFLADAEAYGSNFLESWQDVMKIRKPIIAAVSGYAVRPYPSSLS
jgi:enoyl-CoA hydratase/carnithine racemase